MHHSFRKRDLINDRYIQNKIKNELTVKKEKEIQK